MSTLDNYKYKIRRNIYYNEKEYLFNCQKILTT